MAAFWDHVVQDGHRLPSDRPLDELTAELTTMLGSTDPHLRDEVAYRTLAKWIRDGVYDDLLVGLEDGIASGLTQGLGESGTPSVLRRSFSALVVAECVRRDTRCGLLPAQTVLIWGDRITGWLVRERDLRGFVPGQGWAHALAHGADAVGALADSPALGRLELTVLLDVLADRVLTETDARFLAGEEDRFAHATLRVLRRDLVDLGVLEPWVARLAAHAVTGGPGRDSAGRDSAGRDPFRVSGNAQAYLRALHLHLALAPDPPGVRPDLLLVLVEALRGTNGSYLALPGRGAGG